MKVALILNCGKTITRKIDADKIVCCDGGFKYCPKTPDVILGDFDSFTPPSDIDVEIISHNPHKNESDTELAVRFAKETYGATEIVFYGVTGGRYDHTLCNFAAMKLATTLEMSAVAKEDGVDIYFVNSHLELPTNEGETISILPFGSNAVVSASSNLEYPLDNLLLTNADSRGLSNVSLGGRIIIDVKDGCVIVFRYLSK